MGMDCIEVKDFLEDKRIPENNIEMIIDNLNNRNYKNTLWQA